MAVDAPQVDCPAGAAARAEDIQPRRSSDQRSPNGGRPQHVAAGGEASIPAVDDEFRLEARGLVRLQLGGSSLDVEPSCPDAHGASNGAAGKCFLDMLGVFAEFETNLRRERQLEGIAKAKAAGVYKGRPASIDDASPDYAPG
jgi:Resolvase, N terminal domain